VVATPQPPYFSTEEYLQIEAASPIKHEYIDGRMYAMVGVSDPHNAIGVNLISMLRNHLRGSGCRVYYSDMKARLEERNRFFYPDVMVTCDPRDFATESLYFKRYPSLIVEILSDSTEAFDRGDKFEDYRTLESLREYVLISSKRPLVECYRRSELNLWVLQTFHRESESFQLQSIQFTGSMQQLYEDVILTP
jgi:Uma2 family endonuclease